VDNWLSEIFANPDLARMGHAQRPADRNLGLGWVYYGLARCLRPTLAVVIGSFRGFVPLILGKALSDNLEGGRVVFIDPSYVDDFWKDADAVRRHFSHHGANNVEHHLMTTQDFAASDAYRQLGKVDLLFVDGHHSEEQARYDYETFEPLLAPNALVLFHDTGRDRLSGIYGADRRYQRGVKSFVDKLKADPRLQALDLFVGEGVTVMRRVDSEAETTETTAASREGAVT